MNLFKIRRERLINVIPGDSTIIIFSGNAINKSEDENYPFDVNRNFYYLTGLEKESMILMVNKIDGIISEKLFILPFDEYLAKWVGGRMSKEEASEISGVENVENYDDFKDTLSSLFNRTRKNPEHRFYFDLWHYSSTQVLSPAIRCVNEIKESHPAISINDIFPYIAKKRLVKDEFEITCIKRAIEITNNGVRKMMKNIKPGINEMVMEGVFNFSLAQNLCNKTAFRSICAGGKNATILHYDSNNQMINDGDLFLCDLGATYKNYCADITRTFPANGKFTERQKEIYNVVLGAQKIVQENAKPGATMRTLNKLVVDYYKEELPKHGLNKDVREYYWHSISHHLGLDTHDIEGGLGNVLEAGNIITNEPGLYIEEENIGIRIEDDLLITGTGCEVLSLQIPKTIEEIEKLASI